MGEPQLAKGPATYNFLSQEALLTLQVIRNFCSLPLFLLGVTSGQSLGWVFVSFGSLIPELEIRACMVYKNNKVYFFFQSKSKSNNADWEEILWPE